MLAGLNAQQMKKVISIVDRKEAIRTACMLAIFLQPGIFLRELPADCLRAFLAISHRGMTRYHGTLAVVLAVVKNTVRVVLDVVV